MPPPEPGGPIVNRHGSVMNRHQSRNMGKSSNASLKQSPSSLAVPRKPTLSASKDKKLRSIVSSRIAKSSMNSIHDGGRGKSFTDRALANKRKEALLKETNEKLKSKKSLEESPVETSPNGLIEENGVLIHSGFEKQENLLDGYNISSGTAPPVSTQQNTMGYGKPIQSPKYYEQNYPQTNSDPQYEANMRCSNGLFPFLSSCVFGFCLGSSGGNRGPPPHVIITNGENQQAPISTGSTTASSTLQHHGIVEYPSGYG